MLQGANALTLALSLTASKKSMLLSLFQSKAANQARHSDELNLDSRDRQLLTAVFRRIAGGIGMLRRPVHYPS
jgi:hypothetical protein